MKELLDQLQITRDQPQAGAPGRRTPAARRRTTLLVVLSALLIALAVGSWYVLVTASPLTVEVLTVTTPTGPGSAATVLTAGGYVKDPRVVYVAPKVAGRISALAVKEGDQVRAGDPIALLDRSDLDQEANEARADLEVAEATLARLETGSRPEEIAETRARFQAATLTTERSEREFARARALLDAGVLSEQAFDQTRTDAQVNARNRDAARQALALVEAGPRLEEVRAARAATAAARARWQGATNRLSYTRVVAPVSGRVLRKFRNVGDFVSPDVPYIEGYETIAVGSPVVSLAESGPQEASADVNETDIARITIRQAVDLTPNAYPGEVFHGSVSRISPRADKNKNTVEVKVTIEEAARVLPYDMSVKLTFLAPPAPLRARADVRIPATAVVEKDGRRWVFVAVNGRASRRAVDVGARQGDLVGITGGLADGDRVIVSGLAALADGTAITIK